MTLWEQKPFPWSLNQTVVAPSMANGEGEKELHGVLLYYKFAFVPDLADLLAFYNSNCNSLQLVGRVRLSSNGVNVTVGGKLSSLEKHIETVKSIDLFEKTDFKLANCHPPTIGKVAKESGFTSLSVRIVKELVTFSPCPLLEPPEISNSGRYLSAKEFHCFLQHAEHHRKKLVLLDARNLYETRIGKFIIPEIETLDPRIRQYSDLSTWIDKNSKILRGNNILMYCTGGIRCEMASAYIRSKGAGFENVFQLYGGIQRYLEQFPDGGFFRGKNFVFDYRIAVGSSDANISGVCQLCNSPYDDYSPRCRCTRCRMLVLVCGDCQKEGPNICELCGNTAEANGSTGSDNSITRSPSLTPVIGRKLRILCLHGFRQNASNFRGRTASLAKKLKNIAELVFIDAPHELQFIYQPNQKATPGEFVPSKLPPPDHCRSKFAWFVSPNEPAMCSGGKWLRADGCFDPLQHHQQTGRADESLTYLSSVFSQDGPFDGIMGFSQGAAMAALLCSRCVLSFRFVILCSGFAVNLENVKHGPLELPSLHIFGSDAGKDRQISCKASRDLACLFKESCRVVLEHDLGHIIPTQLPYINQIKRFLGQFI